MSKNKNFHFILPVWGKNYTRLFTDICLPMFFTSGNLRALKRDSGHVFVILTTWEDHLAIRSSGSYGCLEKLIKVEFILIDGFADLSDSHMAMSKCYAMAMRRDSVVPGETYFVFLTPDSFWPDGTFRRLAELADQDFQVVMTGGFRVNEQPVSRILRERIEASPDNPTIPNNELVGIALDNIHQMSDALNWLSRFGFLRDWPSHIYWINKPDRQLIAHCFHLHPLMVLAPKNRALIGTTIDGDFLNNLHYPLNRYYVDQGEFIALELTPAERSWGQKLLEPSVKHVILFALSHANSHHWYFFSKRIVLYSNPDKPIDPLLENMVELFVRKVKRYQILAFIIQHLRIVKIVNSTRYIGGAILKVPRRIFGTIVGAPSK